MVKILFYYMLLNNQIIVFLKIIRKKYSYESSKPLGSWIVNL